MVEEISSLYHFLFFYSLEEVAWNQKFGCLQHARHTPVPLHNSQSAMALLHGYPLGLFDHPKWTSQVRDEQAFYGAYRTAQSGEQVTGSRRFCNRARARWQSHCVGRGAVRATWLRDAERSS